MRTSMFLAALLMVIAIAAGKSAFAQQQGKKDMTTEIMQYVNNYRATKGLEPLSSDPAIVQDAIEHSKNMANKRVPFGHDGFNGRYKDLSNKLSPVMGCAENVACGDVDAEQVVTMWLNSDGHRKNIEGNYNLSGIGVAEGNDGQLYFTQIFVNRNTPGKAQYSNSRSQSGFHN